MTDAPPLLEATCATCTWSNNQYEQQVCADIQMHNQAGFTTATCTIGHW